MYQSSVAAVVPISSTSISNRLLEAVALGVPTITSPIALMLHPEFSGSVIVARHAKDYVEWIAKLVKDEALNENLKRRVSEAYRRHFSPQVSYLQTEKLVRYLSLRS